jgi:hypothetical protein
MIMALAARYQPAIDRTISVSPVPSARHTMPRRRESIRRAAVHFGLAVIRS